MVKLTARIFLNFNIDFAARAASLTSTR